MEIPIVFAVRKQSQRCSNKILRDFSNNQSLLQIAAEKFKNNPLAYIAAHEPEFKLIAEEYNIKFAQRTLKSALSEEVLEIHEYALDLPYKNVCFVNVCCHLIKTETINE